MNTPRAAEALRLGQEHLRAGRHALAADIAAQALAGTSGTAGLHALLGGALMGLGQPARAERSFRDALALQPDYVEAINDLANALRQQGRMVEAVNCYRDALRLQPGLGVVHQNLGTALAEQKQWPGAEASLREAVRLEPARAAVCHDLGVVLQKRARPREALACFQRALELEPRFVLARVAQGRCFISLGELEQAVASCEEALRHDPRSHEALVVLGAALQARGGLAQASGRYREALAIKPDSAEACYQLATVAMAQNRLDEAAAGFRETLRLQKNFALAENNLGNVLLAQARPEDAIACFERTQQLEPEFAGAYSNVLFAMNFLAELPAETVWEAHKRWGERHALPLSGKRLASGASDPNRRLRVGYVSGDFRAHSISLFIEPVLEHHDRRSVEVFCYADVVARDAVTARLESLSDHWVSLTGCSDESAAARIREDGIDVLVDLAGHTGANRLLAFARGPAPVQATWMGYPNTTGMKAMDYRITDALADPPGLTERFYAETLVRMPDSLWCYRPDGIAPPVNRLPALGAGHVTFGSFNNFAKVNSWTRRLWANLLRANPGARLMVIGVPEGSARERVLAEFSSLGIDAARLTLTPRLSRQDFFLRHHDVDIALDPFPFQGGTTTCESLWMGVPVLSLAGKVFAARAGVSLLTNAGLPQLLAQSPEEFAQLGVRLASDLHALSELRQGLRDRMQASPLMNARRFVVNLEAAYREMWGNWCKAG
ncbi:MAG TPA: tetratricopeptide repeat protein [Burkholderiales bacterium]|nr:tetratricopeptide repeat protein [Burkholderiales bacterium]